MQQNRYRNPTYAEAMRVAGQVAEIKAQIIQISRLADEWDTSCRDALWEDLTQIIEQFREGTDTLTQLNRIVQRDPWAAIR